MSSKIYTKLCLCQELTGLRWNREKVIKDCWVLFLAQDVFKEVPVSRSHFSMYQFLSQTCPDPFNFSAY